jgi:hypothetical protein
MTLYMSSAISLFSCLLSLSFIRGGPNQQEPYRQHFRDKSKEVHFSASKNYAPITAGSSVVMNDEAALVADKFCFNVFIFSWVASGSL